MKTITIDGEGWETGLDFYRDLLLALGSSLAWHGASIDAFIDSMVYGGMLPIEPPYEVVVENLGSEEVRKDVQDLADALSEAQQWRLKHEGSASEVRLRLATSDGAGS